MFPVPCFITMKAGKSCASPWPECIKRCDIPSLTSIIVHHGLRRLPERSHPSFLPNDHPLSALGIDFSLDQPGDGELPFPKKEEAIDELLFPGTLDHALDDGWIGEDLVPFISDEAWIGTEGLMTALLGQEQSLSGITLNDDILMVANKESTGSLSRVPI
jgi:hypothetical protein